MKFSEAAQQEKVFEEFVTINPVLSVDMAVGRRAAEIHAQLRRAGQLIEDADLLIAATALVNDCVLVTNNTSHYERINNLELENWAV